MALVFQGSALLTLTFGNVGYVSEQDTLSETTIESRIAESLHFVDSDDIAEAMRAS